MSEQRVLRGDCLRAMRLMEADSFDAIVTDPPYGLAFMGKGWDDFGRVREYQERGGYGNKGVMPGYGRGGTSEQREKFRRTSNENFQAFCTEWASEALRVCKPGAHLLAAGGTRTYHRLVCAIEDAGWEVRDCIVWAYGSGYPKSHDIGKALDREAGAEREVVSEGAAVRRMIPGATQDRTGSWIKSDDREFVPTVTAPATPLARQWDGWGTALKPAVELWCLARKPLVGTVARNVREHGCGGLNIDACRVGVCKEVPASRSGRTPGERGWGMGGCEDGDGMDPNKGRWPANLVLSHAPECRCVGERKVKGSVTIRHNSSGEHFGSGGARPPLADVIYADPDGTETVAAWECAPGCPVAELDRQSGNRAGMPVRQLRRGSSTGRGIGFGSTSSGSEVVTGYGDSGGASRFFATFEPEYDAPFLYCAKAGRKERPRLDFTKQVCDNETVPLRAEERSAWENAGLDLGTLADADTSQARAIIESAFGTLPPGVHGLCSRMCLCGKRPTGRFLEALRYTTSTATSRTTGSTISSLLARWSTSDSTEAANSGMEYGGSRAASVESSSQSLQNTGTSLVNGQPMDAASHAISDVSSATSVLEKIGEEALREIPGHPCVKPVALMEWLLRLVTPPGGRVLDPFCGSGTTLVAARRLGIRAVGIELDPHYCEIARARIAAADTLRVKKPKPEASEPKPRKSRNGQLRLPLAAGNEGRSER